MKTAIFVLIAVATVLVAADDFKKGSAPHHDLTHHESFGQQHPSGGQHQLKEHPQPQHQQPQEHHHPAAPAPQQHQLKQEHEHQPQPHQHHKRETPKQANGAAHSTTTSAPKASVDPKQPSPLPAIVSQPPKQKRDTVTAKPAQGRPTPSAAAKGAGNRPTANVNRNTPKVPLQVPQPGSNAKAPATASAPTTANPAKKL